MPTDPLADLRAELDDLAQRGLRRSLRQVHGPAGPEMEVDGRILVNFCSNNYLDLAAHPALAAAITAAVAAEGTGAGAARLIGGNLSVHRDLEARLAAWKGTEAALLFGSGYQANVGLLSALAGPQDAIFSDSLNHASLVDGARLSKARVVVYSHNDVQALDRALSEAGPLRRRVVATESVFSMEGDCAPLEEMAACATGQGALLVVDEAHATGVLGPRGAGLAARLPGAIQMGTLGKAFGVYGAYVAGPREVIELLANRARSFIFTTALPVPVVAAALAALELVAAEEGEERRRTLWERVAQLRSGLVALRLAEDGGSAWASHPGHVVPLVIGDGQRALHLSSLLLERGLYVQAIRPPTVPEGGARLRVTVMAGHRPEHIDRLLGALGELRPLLAGPR